MSSAINTGTGFVLHIHNFNVILSNEGIDIFIQKTEMGVVQSFYQKCFDLNHSFEFNYEFRVIVKFANIHSTKGLCLWVN